MTRQQPIDAVITWVDGADPKHLNKRRNYLESIGQEFSVNTHKTRFADSGELLYCIKAILKFAPWINNIYLVTDDQYPSFLNDKEHADIRSKVTIIDHKTIFKGYEKYLPTFNSQSISTMLWTIPGLSEQFIYFNDDVFLVNPVKPTDFFNDGKVVLRGKWKWTVFGKLKESLYKLLAPVNTYARSKATKSKNKIAQRHAAETSGIQHRAFYLEHLPFAMRVSTFEQFFNQNPTVLDRQLKHRIREREQFTGEGLAVHLEWLKGTAILDNTLKNALIKAEKDSINKAEKILNSLQGKEQVPFLCIQSLDMVDDAYQKMVLTKMAQLTK